MWRGVNQLRFDVEIELGGEKADYYIVRLDKRKHPKVDRDPNSGKLMLIVGTGSTVGIQTRGASWKARDISRKSARGNPGGEIRDNINEIFPIPGDGTWVEIPREFGEGKLLKARYVEPKKKP